jgi:HTH-type transcriptional regulator/antitoxin HipB
MLFRAQTAERLAAILRSQRHASKLTQRQAAALVGLLPKTISTLESDPARNSVGSLFKLLSALDLELTLRPKTHVKSAEMFSKLER